MIQDWIFIANMKLYIGKTSSLMHTHIYTHRWYKFSQRILHRILQNQSPCFKYMYSTSEHFGAPNSQENSLGCWKYHQIRVRAKHVLCIRIWSDQWDNLLKKIVVSTALFLKHGFHLPPSCCETLEGLIIYAHTPRCLNSRSPRTCHCFMKMNFKMSIFVAGFRNRWKVALSACRASLLVWSWVTGYLLSSPPSSSCRGLKMAPVYKIAVIQLYPKVRPTCIYVFCFWIEFHLL